MALLAQAQAGNAAARDILIARYLPRLQRWATGRLPRWARAVSETQDVVQETVIQTFKRIEAFDARGEGALQAYLRQGVLNRIRDEIRKAQRRPSLATLDPRVAHDGASPLEEAIGREAVDRYERALARMRPEDREAIVARIEMGCSNQEIAAALGKPSANAARMAVERALVRLANEMRKET
ncbi:MAG: hypothetical protein V7647_2782 [Acidobacteriota bacterium]|jgi:RNA polymerase sigma-70 factor (ECF subfamily)